MTSLSRRAEIAVRIACAIIQNGNYKRMDREFPEDHGISVSGACISAEKAADRLIKKLDAPPEETE